MEDIELNTFPSSNIEALALLYVQNQDLKGKTPAEIHTMYQDALYEIKLDSKITVENFINFTHDICKAY